MDVLRGRTRDPVSIGVAAIGLVALVWLAPLMSDQLVFFGDREQTRQASDARQAMLPAAALLLVAATGLLARRHPLHALLTALPALVAVPLSLATPDDAYGPVAYVIAAPISLGALVSAAAPPPRSVPVPILFVAAALVVGLTLLGSPLTLMVLIAAIVWWRLPQEEPAVA